MTADVSSYPPTVVILLSKSLDLLCGSLRLGDWRDNLGSFLPQSWLDVRLGAVSDHFPDYLTYHGFLEQTGQETSFQSIWQFAFQTPSTSLADLTSPAGAMTLFAMVTTLMLLNKKVFQPYFSTIGRKIARAGHGSDWETKNKERMDKFGDYFFRLVFRSMTSIYFVYFFYNAEWSSTSDTLLLWKAYPFQEQTPAMIWYYLIQSTYVLEALISLIISSFAVVFQNPFQSTKTKNRLVSPISIQWSKTCKGDFREMAIHHIITTALVMGSSYQRFTRVGSLIFLIHDVSDIPGIVAKLANCVKYKGTAGASFALTIICWYAARLHMLPFYVLRSILYESHVIVPGVDEIYHRVYTHGIFTYLIVLLIVLHTVWFFMFLGIGYAFVFKGEMHDLTVHKEGEEDEFQRASGVGRPSTSKGSPEEVKKKQK
jgi:hypothetical protein